MKASEVMHLYIGAWINIKIPSTNTDKNRVLTAFLCHWANDFKEKTDEVNCRLQLRRESDMSEQEVKTHDFLKEVKVAYYQRDILKPVIFKTNTPESIAYLLSIGVDVFKLTYNGEADYNPEIYK